MKRFVGLVVSIALGFSGAAFGESPVVQYRMDESSGSTQIIDASGNGINGTLVNGGDFTPGFTGNALVLDGSNDYVDCGNASQVQFTNKFTIGAWINTQATTQEPIMTKSIMDDRTFLLYLNGTGDLIPHLFISNLAGSNWSAWVKATKVVNDGEWHHIVGIFDGDTQRLDLYVDGQIDNSLSDGTIPAQIRTNSVNLQLGKWDVTVDKYYNGRLDETILYDVALTSSEIVHDTIPIDALGIEPSCCSRTSDEACFGVTVMALFYFEQVQTAVQFNQQVNL